jgi:hypothetical protein
VANANVNNGGLHGVVERSGTVSLVAGQYYPIRIQFGENGGGDNMIVSFSNPGLTKTSDGQGFFYTAPPPTTMSGPQPKIFLGPLLSYPSATGTPPTNDGTKLTFTRTSSQYLDFGSQTFDMTKGFSVTCRFAFTGTAGRYERIFDLWTTFAQDSILLYRTGTNPYIGFEFYVGGTSRGVLSCTTQTLTQGVAYSVSIVYDPSIGTYGTMFMYINGSVYQLALNGAALSGSRSKCWVGRSESSDPYLNGDIYSLNIYNRALTANELIGPPAPSPWGIFTATPNGLTSAQAATSGLALRQGYPGYTSGTYWLKPTSGSTPGLAFVDMTTDGGGWTLAYETVTATRVSGSIVYSFNNSSNLSALSFTRVAYSMNNFNSWAFTSFDSWSSTITNYRIPSNNDVFVNQRLVTNLNVVSSNTNVTTGTGLNGALEIWPSNYSTGRTLSMGTYGSDATYDINDSGGSAVGGYGSFQVHDITNLRPVICWNNHDSGSPDIGFGPQASNNPDWTFTNRGATADFRVRVFVR